MKQRRFADAVSLLEKNLYNEPFDNRHSFDYLYALAVGSMYIGDFGTAEDFLDKSKEIKNDCKLDLAYALCHLRRGESDRAVEYYLDVNRK